MTLKEEPTKMFSSNGYLEAISIRKAMSTTEIYNSMQKEWMAFWRQNGLKMICSI
jgi:hypothetical protein